MPRVDQKPLINLSLGRKLLFTLALLLTLGLALALASHLFRKVAIPLCWLATQKGPL